MSFGKTDCAFPRKWRAQNGVSLLTLALLLLMLTGALMAGLAFLRAEIPAEIAGAQKNALADADRALMAFASIHHRLPCPADTPSGAENCAAGKAKGYLPIGALGLDAMFLTPDLRTMRYMVYRNPASLDLAANTLVSVADATQHALPDNAYEPKKSGDTPPPDFNARNGLDMCKIMMNSYGEIDKNSSANYAHYKRNDAVVNVAYGLALSGAGDASGNNSPFDGSNAAADLPEMEMPDRGHGGNYDDLVFVRNLPSLMSAFGCQPIGDTVQQNRREDIVLMNKDYFFKTVGSLIKSTVDFTTEDNLSPTVKIDYTETGVYSPVLASLYSVEKADVVTRKANKQWESTRDSAEESSMFGEVSSTTGVIGNVVSTLKIVDGLVEIGEAAAKAAACLGLCVNQYVAIGFYAAQLVMDGVALGIGVANTAIVILTTNEIGNIYARLGGDQNRLAEQCANSDKLIDDSNKAIREAKDQEKASLLATVNDTKNARDAAKTKLDVVDASIEACYPKLSDEDKAKYDPFYDTESRDDLFEELRKAEQELSLYQKEVRTYEKDANDTDVTKQEVQDKINESIDAFKKELKDAGNTDAQIEASAKSYRQSIVEQYKKEHENSLIEKEKSQAKVDEWQPKVDAAKIAVEEKINALPEPNYDDPENPPPPVCVDAYNGIHGPYWQQAGWSDSNSCVSELESRTFCDASYYFSLWSDYRRKQNDYEDAVKNLEDFKPPVPMEKTCNSSTSNTVQLWEDNELNVLRSADKRGVLQ
jgi:hypothetical protein